jgi:hypothetical protein
MSGGSITLGGRVFAIEPLKLGQLRGLLDALDDLSGKSGGAMLDAAAKVIRAGLARTAPELTHEQILDLEATVDEVTAAVAAILSAAGLTRAGEASPVASPEPARATSSPASTVPSPPAAATPLPLSTI